MCLLCNRLGSVLRVFHKSQACSGIFLAYVHTVRGHSKIVLKNETAYPICFTLLLFFKGAYFSCISLVAPKPGTFLLLHGVLSFKEAGCKGKVKLRLQQNCTVVRFA